LQVSEGQATSDSNPWMNADNPSVACRAKEGKALADFAEKIRDTTGVSLWRLHMIELIRYIVSSLVEESTKVKIEEKEESGRFVYYIKVDEKDRGKIIGKEGKTIKAIRSLASAAATKVDRKTVVKIVD